MALTAKDRKILACLQNDGRMSNVALAEKVGISQSHKPRPCGLATKLPWISLTVSIPLASGKRPARAPNPSMDTARGARFCFPAGRRRAKQAKLKNFTVMSTISAETQREVFDAFFDRLPAGADARGLPSSLLQLHTSSAVSVFAAHVVGQFE